MEIKISILEETYQKLKQDLNDEQIKDLLIKELELFSELKFSIIDKHIFTEFCDFKLKKAEALKKYNPAVTQALRRVLNELMGKRVFVQEISDRLNVYLLDLKLPQYTPEKTSKHLIALGLYKRKSCKNGHLVFVDPSNLFLEMPDEKLRDTSLRSCGQNERGE